LPGILPQLGADGLETLRKLASSFQGGASADDDVPELVENFEDASKK
jgi:nascent polypeptide-associated complex subunit beta